MAIKSDYTGIFQFHGFRYIRKILKKLSLFTPYYGTRSYRPSAETTLIRKNLKTNR